MNGTQTSDFLFPKEIESQIKKKLTLKFIVVLILSNLSVFMLSSPSEDMPKEDEIIILGSLITIKLRPYVTLRDPKTAVTLYDSQNNLLSLNAFIIKKVEEEGQIFGEKEELYEVEVPTADLAKVMTKTSNIILAYPQGLDLTHKKITKRGPYEIIF